MVGTGKRPRKRAKGREAGSHRVAYLHELGLGNQLGEELDILLGIKYSGEIHCGT